MRQSELGADIAVTGSAPIDTVALGRSLEDALRGVGLDNPRVTVTRVEQLARQGVGKLKRFIPL